ncbi:MAG: ABC transporter ATP-binding protein [Candidatus Bathyarchaeia archaeon]
MECKNLVKYFPVRAGFIPKTIAFNKAVDRVDLAIKKGETFGLVGESGCGKTTLGKALIRLIEPTSGEIIFDGLNLLALDEKQMQNARSKMQIVFQDPFGSLDPHQNVLGIVGEPLEIYKVAKGDDVTKRVSELIERVGLSKQHLYRLPHEFSGGQRQRIGIARALALQPHFIVLDEPTSALDVSVQAQILELLKALQTDMNLTYLFISHDLSVVRHMSDRIGVMYLGRIVEHGPTSEVFNKPLHPYTQALLSSILLPDPDIRQQAAAIKGTDVPSPINPPSGCRFRTRCPVVRPECPKREPNFIETNPDHFVDCIMYE